MSVKGTDKNVTIGKFHGHKGKFFLRKGTFCWDLYFIGDELNIAEQIDWTISLCFSDDLIDKYNDYKRIVKDGMVYVGEVKIVDRTRIPHGYGIAKLSNGWKYIGEWHDGEMHGKGCMRNSFDDREYFHGQWKEGKPVLHVDEDTTCPICLEKPSPSEITSLFPCKHLFCHSCISRWLSLQGKCPLCWKAPLKIPSFAQPHPELYSKALPPTQTIVEEDTTALLKESQKK